MGQGKEDEDLREDDDDEPNTQLRQIDTQLRRIAVLPKGHCGTTLLRISFDEGLEGIEEAEIHDGANGTVSHVCEAIPLTFVTLNRTVRNYHGQVNVREVSEGRSYRFNPEMKSNYGKVSIFFGPELTYALLCNIEKPNQPISLRNLLLPLEN